MSRRAAIVVCASSGIICASGLVVAAMNGNVWVAVIQSLLTAMNVGFIIALVARGDQP